MKILRGDNLKKTYGIKELLNDVSFFVRTGDLIGLIGINGTGKSTLMNILAGKDSADSGQLDFPHDYKIGYLSQQVDFDENLTVLDTVFQGDTPIIRAVKAYEQALTNLELNGEDPKFQKQYQKAEELMNQEDAWLADTNAKTILSKLGILFLDKKVGELSGGQKKRLGLAQVLIEAPDLLLLDEPTNHLDYQSIRWLENYLKDYKGALIVTTHDRYFLDRVTNKIMELSQGNLYEYPGNYQAYLAMRAEREETEATQAHKKKQLFKQELAWMRAGIKARGTRQQARVDRFHDLKKEVSHSGSSEQLEIGINTKRLGKKVLEIKEASYEIVEKPILKDFDLLIQSRERLGITGENGAGKSTLLNLIDGKLELDSGEIELGETVRIGYYTQENEGLDESKRMISYLQEQAEMVEQKDGSSISTTELLERFLFPRNVHGTVISNLSGGEKRRLYLLKILIQQPNVLLLDEPTNDLDIETLTILEDYIEHFQGAVISVSHDRYFLDKTMNKLLVFKGNTEIEPFFGTMSDYLETHTLEKNSKVENKVVKEAVVVETNVPKEKKKLTYMEQKEWDSIEDDIESLEEKIESIQEDMLTHSSDALKLQELQKEVTLTETVLEEKMSRWEYLSQYIED
ncbi:ABC-F family ATP-binding cassette domain-containing protein [Vagococcus fluvialis]|uniref:ABC-F family ATP-binding cassette domain-containing protein n=1 Tax=Vagococcus fluvialis TaxID=2738 RepID=UPI001A8C8CCB|nr:ABC-F family ATP-binding cassette domain-containing protein [Vagococcus fluvialis]MBO0478992.1 ABC-F family ATP-binding cassette domain-containing protein [Vagococcus fluvialis]MBO0484066.1 ABC-F family ATP-binding cassette domain-containing protein [Vagococcus fluvialis]MDT2746244.1 ABC-F family ATP-binding cassette domain-containing protein [Vagococcus fluvialis]MDT2781318.1 ABC-F family ATP-binding cassette domain-containing protein [Vagococcus fluvialis]